MEYFDMKQDRQNNRMQKKNTTSDQIIIRDNALPATLGVVMIVKNEEKNIGKILGDIKDIVDEIVVVDTGSTDRTLEILKSLDVTIGNFAWCDDFSAARNASIAIASSDYLLWLDADDRLNSVAKDAILKLKQTMDPRKNHAYMLKIVNTAENYAGTISSQLRIFPNREHVRFEGRLHEQIISSLMKIGEIKIDKVDIAIEHTGYHDEALVMAKGKRNLAIQLKELQENNNASDARKHFYIAMSYQAAKDYAKSLEYIDKAWKISRNEYWYKYSFNIATDCYLKLGQIDLALKEAEDGVAHFPESGSMHYNLGAVSLVAKKYERSLDALEKASHLGMEFDVFPTPPNIQATLPHYRGIALEKTDRRDEAILAYRKSVEINPHWGPALKSLGLVLVQKGDIEEAIIHLEKAKSESQQLDLKIWLTLAKIYTFKNQSRDAHNLYVEVVKHIPSHRDALAGLIQTSITLDDVEGLLGALEPFMQSFGMNTDREIGGIPELAGLCANIGGHLLEEGDPVTGKKLLDAALQLDDQCNPAYLFYSDLEYADGRIPQAIENLEKALISGAAPDMVESRMKQFECQAK